MIRPLVSIRDKLNGFNPPMVETNIATAKRNFSYAVNQNDLMAFDPKYYDLYQIGEFNDETGHIKAFDIPELVIEGVSAYLENDVGELIE